MEVVDLDFVPRQVSGVEAKEGGIRVELLCHRWKGPGFDDSKFGQGWKAPGRGKVAT